MTNPGYNEQTRYQAVCYNRICLYISSFYIAVTLTVLLFVREFHELDSFRYTFDTPSLRPHSLYIQVNLHV